MPRRLLFLLVAAIALLGGCDMIGGALGIESPEKLAAARDADGRAVGGACRHAGRAIEDCYALNKKADRAAVFAGWRDMNDYMRENKIDAVAPTINAATQLATNGVKPGREADEAKAAAPEKSPPKPIEGKPKAREAKESKDSKDAKSGETTKARDQDAAMKSTDS